MTDSHIESLYQEAKSALKARDYEYAIELLKRVLVVDEIYKDTSRLLEKAVRLRKLRWYKNPRLWGALGLAVVFVLGIVIAPRIGSLFASPAPTETISRTPEYTATNAQLPTPPPTATALTLTQDSDASTSSNPEIEANRLLFKRTMGSSPGAITSLSWSSSGTHLSCTVGLNTATYILEVSTTEYIGYFGCPDPVYVASWIPGKFLISMAGGCFHTWDATQAGATQKESLQEGGGELEGEGMGAIRALQYTDDGKYLIAGTDQGYMGIWHVNGTSLSLIRRTQIDSSPIYATDWHPDGVSYLTLSEEKGLQIWNQNQATVQKQLDYTSASAEWSPDDRYIAIDDRSLRDGNLYLEVIAPDGKIIARTQTEGFIHRVAWSPDGTVIATANGDERVLFWVGFENGTLEPILQISLGLPVMQVAWSPNRTMLAAGDSDGNIWVWNVEGMEFTQ